MSTSKFTNEQLSKMCPIQSDLDCANTIMIILVEAFQKYPQILKDYESHQAVAVATLQHYLKARSRGINDPQLAIEIALTEIDEVIAKDGAEKGIESNLKQEKAGE